MFFDRFRVVIELFLNCDWIVLGSLLVVSGCS